jgi:translation initiation factor IF-2
VVEKKEQYLDQAPKAVQEKKNQLIVQPYILSDLAGLLSKTTSDLILVLLKWGILSSKNQQLPEELVERIAGHYEIPTIKKIEKPKDEQRVVSAASGGQLKERLPVVVVMGHVDHGKTTLLDFIRKSRVAAKEKGGITQHLGAYEAKTPQGDLVFIDTPGHEAFPKIRIRGTKVADVVILVVAADDGIMPQTIEALKHAQGMNVPIIVAINKIDKVDKARIDIVKRDLATQHNLLPEEWGGQTVYMPISAKTGAGIDKLLEMLVLQSQLMELKTEAVGPARGFILESKLEKGRGVVATVLTQHGILSIGDYFVAGKTTGKISSMVDSFGNRVDNVAASHPVQIAGFNELPDAGDYFEIIDKDTYLKTKNVFAGQRQPTLARAMNAQNAVTLIIKTDTNSSKEALLESIGKLSKKSEKPFIVLQSGIGNVTESDVMLAADTNSRIITLHVKAESNATNLAQRNEVSIHSFDIIYKLLEFLQDLLKSLEPIKTVKVKTGEAFVRKVFDIKNIGVIAGCYVKQGVLSRDGQVVIWRGSKKIGEGKILSLQRDKNTVKEVHAGFECAFTVEDFKDWQIDDRIECFVERAEQQPKKSS